VYCLAANSLLYAAVQPYAAAVAPRARETLAATAATFEVAVVVLPEPLAAAEPAMPLGDLGFVLSNAAAADTDAAAAAAAAVLASGSPFALVELD